MSDQNEFIQTIQERPDDDSLRLVYADWLEEHGDPPRAEFVRIQCSIAAMPEDVSRRSELLRRQEDLLDAHRDHWLAELPPGVCKVDDFQPVFSRGFPSTLEVECATFVARGEELYRAAPVLDFRITKIGKRLPVPPADLSRVLRGLAAAPVEGVEAGIAALAASPLLARVRSLSLSDVMPEHLAALLTSPHIPSLQGLSIGSRIGPRGAELVARWPKAGSLRKLAFFFGAIGAEGASALAASPHLGNLAGLELHGCFIGNTGAQALAGSTTLTRLKTLALGYNKIGPEGIATLLHSPNMGPIEELKISFNGPRDDGPGDAGLAALASSSTLRHLRSLELQESRITAEGVRLLSGAAHLGTLRSLDLKNNPIGPAGAVHLAASPHLAGLRWLSLEQAGLDDQAMQALAGSRYLRPRVLLLQRSALDDPNRVRVAPPSRNVIGPEGLAFLSRSPLLGTVEDLDLSYNEVGDAGLTALAGSPHARSIQRLRLFGCGLYDDGVLALSRAAWGTSLRYLNLAVNDIGDNAGVALAAWPRLSQLRQLNLGDNALGDATAAALAGSPRVAELRHLELGQNRITDAGARALADSPHLAGLRRLVLWHNPLTEAGMEPLWQRFGDHVYPQRKQWQQRPHRHQQGPG